MQAEQALKRQPSPVSSLRSAGVEDKNDPYFIASRAALQDSDSAVILALSYVAFNRKEFHEMAKFILLKWSEVNIPTGNPIDETRLDGLVWAFAIICEELNADEVDKISEYFEAMYQAKKKWKFGPKTALNNHKTHQLKMQMLIARALGNVDGFRSASESAAEHVQINIDASTGESIDYIQRDALYYHVYDLEAWLDIALISECCDQQVKSAYWYVVDKLQRHETGDEFKNSTAAIDENRAAAGFHYAKVQKFEIKRMARSTLAYIALERDVTIPQEMVRIARENLDRRLLFHKVRALLEEDLS
ncbi:hypothetical protein GCM10027217_10920 [Pseudomaricurvus hydrocarbonicus]